MKLGYFSFISTTLFCIFYSLLFFLLLLSYPLILQTKLHFLGLSDTDSVEDKSLFQYINKMHVVEMEDQSKKWEVFAQSGESLVYQHQWRLYNLRLFFYNRGFLQFKVEGLEGKVDFHLKNMSLKNEVHISTGDGYEIYADRVYYKNKLESLYMWRGDIHKGRGGLKKAYARKMKIEIPKKKIFVSKGYFFHYVVRRDSLYVVGTGAELNQQKGVYFENAVMVLFLNTRLFSDRAELTYKEDQLVSLLLKDNVIMLRRKELIFAKELYIDLVNNDFTFEGDILWIQDGEKILGDKLKIKDKGKNITIEGAVIQAFKKSINKNEETKQ